MDYYFLNMINNLEIEQYYNIHSLLKETIIYINF